MAGYRRVLLRAGARRARYVAMRRGRARFIGTAARYGVRRELPGA